MTRPDTGYHINFFSWHGTLVKGGKLKFQDVFDICINVSNFRDIQKRVCVPVKYYLYLSLAMSCSLHYQFVSTHLQSLHVFLLPEHFRFRLRVLTQFLFTTSLFKGFEHTSIYLVVQLTTRWHINLYLTRHISFDKHNKSGGTCEIWMCAKSGSFKEVSVQRNHSNGPLKTKI